jgi:hypothetical protein
MSRIVRNRQPEFVFEYRHRSKTRRIVFREPSKAPGYTPTRVHLPSLGGVPRTLCGRVMEPPGGEHRPKVTWYAQDASCERCLTKMNRDGSAPYYTP